MLKKCIAIFLLITILCFMTGCELNVNISDDGYQNKNTKDPSVTDSTDGVENTSVPTSTSLPESDGNVSETDGVNTPADTGNPSQTAGVPHATENPNVTGTDGDVQGDETNAPVQSNTSSSTPEPTSSSANKPTAYPTVAPTSPPVITQGPSEYFILTLDNGGGGGYVYINQNVDTDTGEPGATNVNKGWFEAGSYVSISAVPYEGCTFAGWMCGDDFISPSADYNFVMPERDYPLTAVFVF